jgi:hypothetical protein
MGASAIAIAIKVATTPAARFTVYPSAFRPAPFSPLAGLGLFHRFALQKPQPSQ